MARKRLEASAGAAAVASRSSRKSKPAKASGAEPSGPPPPAGKEPRFERVQLDRVNPAPYNPRKDLQPGDPEFAKLCKSIDEFGCAQVLVYNERTGNLVGGHQTLKVLRHLGRTSAMMSIVDLPAEREKALNIALNRIRGDWDLGKLQAVMEDLEAADDPDLIELTGFEDGELDKMLAALDAGGEEDVDDGGGRGSDAQVGSSFEAVAVCNDEAEQQRAFNVLKEHGFTCKLRTLY